MNNHKNNNNQKYIQYFFSKGKNKNIFFNTSISQSDIRKIFTYFSKKIGQNNELIKEYSVYKNDDLELTVYPDGSSFCWNSSFKLLNDSKVSDNINIIYVEKYKLSNDLFPCLYSYESVVDIIDIIFNINKNISVVISTNYENNRNYYKTDDISEINNNEKWFELYLKVKPSAKIENINNLINEINILL